MRYRSLRFFFALMVLSSSLPSCAFFNWLTGANQEPSPEAEQVEASSEEGLSKSQEEWEQRITQSSWLVSGEYFRQKKDDPWIVLRLPSLWEKKEQAERQKSLEERIARLEQELGKGAPLQPASPWKGLKQKIALVGLKGEEAERLASELSKSGQVFVVEPPLVEQALREVRLTSAQESRQVALTLGEALGVQLVVFVERAERGRKGGTEPEWWLSADLVDGLMGALVGTLRARSLPPGVEPSGSLKADFLNSVPYLAGVILQMAREHEWMARVVSVEKGKVVIYAGRRSGLVEGDILQVFSPGFEVVHPTTKMSLGAAPGEYKGKVQVVAFVGQEALVAKPVEGSLPSPNDIVKFDER